MLCLSGFELYSCWVPLNVYHLNKRRTEILNVAGSTEFIRLKAPL